MRESTRIRLEHDRSLACQRLDGRRADMVGALADLQQGLDGVVRMQRIGQVLPTVAGIACAIAGIGGYWLLTRRGSRLRWWQLSLIAWRYWTLRKEAGRIRSATE